MNFLFVLFELLHLHFIIIIIWHLHLNYYIFFTSPAGQSFVSKAGEWTDRGSEEEIWRTTGL